MTEGRKRENRRDEGREEAGDSLRERRTEADGAKGGKKRATASERRTEEREQTGRREERSGTRERTDGKKREKKRATALKKGPKSHGLFGTDTCGKYKKANTYRRLQLLCCSPS
eukprot:CAMPEP_0184338446 /NCGR_PEP_ID=MMETSP1089-20130417/6989_1 /TAXON_ID=38269 ORGANISM="Gloeochaete wittrockiana, Strain SAG46.84" /NCGR_SAMPLE_ID=MMETSP1089 /ASSEMBLY_ACC=CAM_ASM_000445 /LENGTH=113 /DNA_ID=CAMNT_0026664961 /DNA_START=378 /DNA_END=715 /DNA_ORIENTATION=+